MTDDVGRIDAVLDRLLPRSGDGAPPRLAEAMRYAVLGGGKRIRPRLVYAAGRLAGGDPDMLDLGAAAVEFVHAYSLIHDDLPAMDDDDLRRGRPTVHVRFDEATAILAGDALQALAFATASAGDLAPDIAQCWVYLLATAAGAGGMAGGQMLDLVAEARTATLAELETLHAKKTGTLICTAVLMGAAAGTLDAAQMTALSRYGAEIGLAFQIRDDVLDATAATAVLGKQQGADARRGKSTYVSLLGVDGARAEADRRLAAALAHLRPFGAAAQPLAALARLVVEREN